MTEFLVRGEYIELIQLLKALKFVNTGGHAKIVVEEGEVKLNGEVEYRKRAKLRDGDRVEYDGHVILVKQ